MCTVVCRWSADEAYPVQMLALRDELVSRAFDLPGAWWPDQPDLIGGRDRQAGGSWCVSDICAGVTAVVLNRPERPAAVPGAPSRGILPLVAARHRERWPSAIELAGMAGFSLVLATPDALRWWSYDGEQLRDDVLGTGTHMFTPGGLRSPADVGFAAGRIRPELDAPTGQVWHDWLAVVDESVPGSDPSDLLVRRAAGDDTFETVFGQFIAARPGTLRLDWRVRPTSAGSWATSSWTAARQAR